MYRKKLLVFVTFILAIIVLNAVLVVVSNSYIRSNITQTTIAQNLLDEHLVVSSISYRLFKQLTDELIFGEDANQAVVRNKRAIIGHSFDKIIKLEKQQREALGKEQTQGSVEDTQTLIKIIDEIIAEFKLIIGEKGKKSLGQRDRVQHLLEVSIDNNFREAINSAVSRQSKVVASLKAKSETINQAVFWYTLTVVILAIPLVIFGVYWLLAILYHPLNSIKLGAEAISQGNYSYRISRGFDSEFDAIAASFNSMAEKLSKQKLMVEKSTKELEYEVSQRTLELREANQLLQSNDTARKEFLADISHELRTPLSVIRGEIQVTLRQQAITENDYRLTLETVLDQSLNLSHLIDDLLMIAKTESGKLRVIPRNIDLKLFLDQIKSQTESFIADKNIKLEVQVGNDLSFGTLDPDRITQVFMIILDNAFGHAGETSQISIDCRKENNDLIFKIADDGDGIEQDIIPYIFNRYFRGSDSRMGQGAGLGLAIAKTIIEAHGGSIQVSSELSVGTEFTFSIPQESQGNKS